MRKLLVATTNPMKAGEMVEILAGAGLDLDILTLTDFPGAPPVDETGETFEDNARLKARAAVAHSGLVAIADDGGLVIDALDGAPGVHSHRFLGEKTTFMAKMGHILTLMQDVAEERRTCRFVCAVAIMTPDGRIFDFEGTCEGRIGHEMRGTGGFGYDPIFRLPNSNMHMAELTPEQKHAISHRGKALDRASNCLRTVFN